MTSYPPPRQPGQPAYPPGYPPAYAPGYPAYGPGYPPGFGMPGGPPWRRAVNPAAIVVALVGGAVALVGAFVDWYQDIQLGDIVNALDADGAKAFPKAYFGWLMWVLLAATVVTALFAALPGGAAGACRVISPLLGVLGAILVIASLNQLITRGSVFDHSSAGLFLTLLGFLGAALGGLLGTRRVP